MNRAITFLALGLAMALLLLGSPWWQSDVATPPPQPPDAPLLLPEPVPAVTQVEVVATDEVEARIPVPVPASAPTSHLTVRVEREGVAVGAGITVLAAALPAVDSFADDRATATGADGCAAFALPAGDYRCRTPHGGSADVRLAPAQRGSIVLEIGEGCAVEGHVTDGAGVPIGGAEILLCDADAAARAHAVARSDREGAFRFLAGAGHRGVAARHADFAPSPVQRTVVRRGEPARVAIVLQRERGRLLGIVVDAAGTAVADAVIATQAEPSAAPPVCLRTDRAGAFATPPLAPGPHVLLATAAGFGIARVRVTVAGHDEVLRVELPAGATVRGTVRDAAGGPAAGALVWSGQRPSFGSRLARTDDYGFFELTGLPAGAVELTAVHAPAVPGGGGLQRANAQVQLVAGGASEWNPTLAARAGGTVRGRVEPPHGEGAGGWRVLAQPGGGRSFGTETAEDGTFAIAGLPRGTVDLSVHEPGASWTSFAVAALGSVAVDGPEVAIPVPEAAERSTVRGRILADARPVVAEVRLVHEATKAVAAHATRADGTFEFERVPPGRLRLEVRPAGRSPLIVPPFDLAPRTVHDVGTVQLPAGRVVQGRILGPHGRPPSALQVRVLDAAEHDAGAAEILGDGYRTPGLCPGPHWLIVQADDFAAARTAFTVTDAEDQTLDVQLVAGTQHRLRVATRVDEHQSSPVSILLYNGERRPIWTAHLPMHGGVAEFRACLEPGSYSVRALGMDGYRAAATFRVEAGTSAGALTELQLELPPR